MTSWQTFPYQRSFLFSIPYGNYAGGKSFARPGVQHQSPPVRRRTGILSWASTSHSQGEKEPNSTCHDRHPLPHDHVAGPVCPLQRAPLKLIPGWRKGRRGAGDGRVRCVARLSPPALGNKGVVSPPSAPGRHASPLSRPPLAPRAGSSDWMSSALRQLPAGSDWGTRRVSRF